VGVVMTMDRIADVDMVELDALIATELANAQSAQWGDGDLTARIDDDGFDTSNPDEGTLADPRTRAVVAYYAADNGSWQPTRLKVYDHVMMLGIAPCVVAGPARGREYFLAYAPEYYGAQLVTLKWDIVTDRAPEDPEEEPMPIDEPPPGEPPPAGDEVARLRAALTTGFKTMLSLIRRERPARTRAIYFLPKEI
jgi:hypothetical protein